MKVEKIIHGRTKPDPWAEQRKNYLTQKLGLAFLSFTKTLGMKDIDLAKYKEFFQWFLISGH